MRNVDFQGVANASSVVANRLLATAALFKMTNQDANAGVRGDAICDKIVKSREGTAGKGYTSI